MDGKCLPNPCQFDLEAGLKLATRCSFLLAPSQLLPGELRVCHRYGRRANDIASARCELDMALFFWDRRCDADINYYDVPCHTHADWIGSVICEILFVSMQFMGLIWVEHDED